MNTTVCRCIGELLRSAYSECRRHEQIVKVILSFLLRLHEGHLTPDCSTALRSGCEAKLTPGMSD